MYELHEFRRNGCKAIGNAKMTFVVLHLLGGVILGGWFRFAILLPAFSIVVIEAAISAIYPLFWPWYLILIVGLGALQAGYVAASFLRPRGDEKRAPSTTASVSAPE